MKSVIRYKWTCPHCGLEQVQIATLMGSCGTLDRKVALCDVDEGGCNELVVLAPELTITSVVYKLVEAEYAPQT